MRHILSVFTPSSRFSSLSGSILKSGDIISQTRIYSNSDILEYSKLTYDSNPLHFDHESAQKAGFVDRLVPGMLVASLFPSIIASHFPGAVYVSQSLQFKMPIYIGEEIIGEVQATNIKKFRNKHLAIFKTKCFKDGNQLVIDGEATTLLPTLTIGAQDLPS